MFTLLYAADCRRRILRAKIARRFTETYEALTEPRRFRIQQSPTSQTLMYPCLHASMRVEALIKPTGKLDAEDETQRDAYMSCCDG